jgi:hypothetical protein
MKHESVSKKARGGHAVRLKGLRELEGTPPHRRMGGMILGKAKAVDNRQLLIQPHPCNHCFLPVQKRAAWEPTLSNVPF